MPLANPTNPRKIANGSISLDTFSIEVRGFFCSRDSSTLGGHFLIKIFGMIYAPAEITVPTKPPIAGIE